MILTVHILTGAAILAKTQNPILGFLFAFLSHFVLDTIPHQQYPVNNITGRQWQESKADFLKIVLDLLLGFLIVLFLICFISQGQSFTSEKQLQIFLGGFSGVLADAFTLLYFLFPKIKFLEMFYNFHQKIHIFNFKNETSPTFLRKVGLGSQILISFISIYFLLPR